MSLVREYLNQKISDEIFEKNIAYPLLTWTDGGEIMQKVLPYNANKKTIRISKCNNKDLIDIVRSSVSSGGCVGIIMNTVSLAQSAAKLIKNEITDNVLLYHAQYIMPDRAAKEEILLERIGSDSKPEKRRGFVVIGTQVLEQYVVKSQLYYRFDLPFREWLRSIDPQIYDEKQKYDKQSEWQSTARRITELYAQELVSETNDTAIIGHKEGDKNV